MKKENWILVLSIIASCLSAFSWHTATMSTQIQMDH